MRRLTVLLIYTTRVCTALAGGFFNFYRVFLPGRLLSVSMGPSRPPVTRGYMHIRPWFLIDPYQRCKTGFLQGVFSLLVIFGPTIGRTIIQPTATGCTGSANNYNSSQCGRRRLWEPIWSVPGATTIFLLGYTAHSPRAVVYAPGSR